MISADIIVSQMIVILVSIIVVSLLLLIIKWKYSLLIEKLYSQILDYLATHKSLAIILSHGGIHIVVIIICCVLICQLYGQIMDNNQYQFNQVIYTFHGDTLGNYKLNYLKFKKDISRRPTNVFYNKGDFEFEYGYEKDTAINNHRYIAEISKKDSGKIDLVSKVEYLSINERLDTLFGDRRFHYVKGRGYDVVERLSNHHKFYYSYSPLTDTIHIFKRRTDANDPLKEWNSLNPYHCLWLGFDFREKPVFVPESEIRIVYNKLERVNPKGGIFQPITLDKVYPQPTSTTVKEIVYKGKELEEVLNQGGIYITGVDPVRKDVVDRLDIIYSVLIGTIAAFILDIIVSLIVKWKKLKKG